MELTSVDPDDLPPEVEVTVVDGEIVAAEFDVGGRTFYVHGKFTVAEVRDEPEDEDEG